MRTSARPTRFIGTLTAAATALVLAGCTSAGTGSPTDQPTDGDQGASVAGTDTISSDSGPPSSSAFDGTAIGSGYATQVRTPSPTGSGPAPGSPSGSDASSTTDGTKDAQVNEALLKAAETALGTVPASTLISIESEKNDTQWEVEVVTADGTEYEIELSADGATVRSGPTKQQDSESDKAKHRDRVASAELDYRAAVDKITDQMPGGRIGELDLDTENGRTVWEADVYDSSGAKHEVDIDAATGELVKGG